MQLVLDLLFNAFKGVNTYILCPAISPSATIVLNTDAVELVNLARGNAVFRRHSWWLVNNSVAGFHF